MQIRFMVADLGHQIIIEFRSQCLRSYINFKVATPLNRKEEQNILKYNQLSYPCGEMNLSPDEQEALKIFGGLFAIFHGNPSVKGQNRFQIKNVVYQPQCQNRLPRGHFCEDLFEIQEERSDEDKESVLKEKERQDTEP